MLGFATRAFHNFLISFSGTVAAAAAQNLCFNLSLAAYKL